MLYRTVALALLVAVSAVPIQQQHSARVAKLQAVDPTATRAACEACVDAEDILITKLTSEEAAMQAEAAAATDHATEAEEHDAAVSVLATATSTVATRKAAVQAIVTGDLGDLAADSPAGILSSTTALSTAAQAWADSIAARASAQGVVDGAQADRDVAKAAERDAEAALAAASGLVTSARAAADAACTSMRNGGYGYVAPTKAPPITTAAPITEAAKVAPITTAAPITEAAKALPTTAAPTAPTEAAIAADGGEMYCQHHTTDGSVGGDTACVNDLYSKGVSNICGPCGCSGCALCPGPHCI